ncbi:hypothetical protein IWQ57_006337, partial [Coemansia nantahalensis]
ASCRCRKRTALQRQSGRHCRGCTRRTARSAWTTLPLATRCASCRASITSTRPASIPGFCPTRPSARCATLTLAQHSTHPRRGRPSKHA